MGSGGRERKRQGERGEVGGEMEWMSVAWKGNEGEGEVGRGEDESGRVCGMEVKGGLGTRGREV